MADEENEVQEKKGGKKFLIIIILVVVLAGAGAAVFFLAPGLIGMGGDKDGAEGEPAAGEEQVKVMVMVDMKPFIVNLVSPSGKRYLKLVMTLELEGEMGKEEMAAKSAQVRDAILVFLSGLEMDQIDTEEKKLMLKQQIAGRVNPFLTTAKVRNVYFSEFVVQ